MPGGQNATLWLRPLCAVVALGGVVALAIVFLPDTTGTHPAQGNIITVSRSACGQGWSDPHPGTQTFQLHNAGVVSAEVDLIDPESGAVYGEVEGLGPNTTRPLEVTLGNGTYAFRCLPENANAITGPIMRITGGENRSGPAVVPVTDHDLLEPLARYQQYVATGLATVATDVGALRTAAHTGNRGATERAWLTAHIGYERLGAAYGAFGSAGAAINGTAAGKPDGTTDKDFTGFHRIEYDLWHGTPMSAVAAEADQLAGVVDDLRRHLDQMQIDGVDLSLRAHEITEDALQFELTTKTDYGSGSNLATVMANLDGTRAVIGVLRPLLTSRLSNLSEVDNWLDRAQNVLQAERTADRHWTPVQQLPRSRRELINATISELTEKLASIAAITSPRRTS